MTKPLWRMRNKEGQEHSFWEATAKGMQYSAANFGKKAGHLALGALGAGITLKLAIDLVEGNYDGDVVNQAMLSFQSNVPWKIGFAKSMVYGTGGIMFGEGYGWLKRNVFHSGQAYNKVAEMAATENVPVRDARREAKEQSKLEEEASRVAPSRGRTGAL